jgi:uncharacterized protein DUF3180
MHATRIRDLILYALGAGVVVWLLVRGNYGSFPDLEWFVPLSLPVLAVFEAMTGVQLRARIHRKPGTNPVEPLTAARAVALAKATAIVGAVMAGAWGGLLVYVVPKRDMLAAAGHDTTLGSVGAAGAVVLVVAALWLEYCCRTPKPPDQDEDSEPERWDITERERDERR